MRLPGYCEKCRKIKQVRVKRPMPGRNVQVGICAQCEQEEDDKRKEHNR